MVLSVAVCTYNGARYIKEQLNSILNQQLRVDEIVICDDGSSDNTLSIVQEIADANTGVKWLIHQNHPNIGVLKNFEKSISLCTGEIIFLSDQDDIWRKDKTKVIVDYFEHNPETNVIFTDADLVDAEGKKLTEHSLLDSVYLLPYIDLWKSGLQFEILNSRNRATGATMAIRSSFRDKILPFADDEECLHDQQMAMVGVLYNTIDVITDRLISYRQHGKNAVGVNLSNWVYANEECPELLPVIAKASACKSYYGKIRSLHKSFNNKRLFFINCPFGKIILLLMFPVYICLYRKYWRHFILSDLRYSRNYR